VVQQDKVCCLVNPGLSNNSFLFTVSVPQKITESFFQLASQRQQSTMNPIGFKKGLAPLSYIQEHFKTPMISHLKDLGLKFFGINTLLQQIRAQKIVIVGNPELKDISVDSQGQATYTFAGQSPKELYMQSWKYLPFKATPRKKYRDIDKQVLSFLQDEETMAKSHDISKGIKVGDWVCFKAWVIDQHNQPIFDQHCANIWLRIGDEEPDLDFQNIFLGKKTGDKFITDNPSFQSYFCENSSSNYTFIIEVQDVIPYHAFSFDLFKNYFKIKTHKDLLAKMTEVFSFSNDISQRRSIAHEALGIIIKKNHIVLPEDSIIEKKREIIKDLQFKPDFMVYKMNPQFDENISNMAKRQLLDGVVAEFIGYQDNVTVAHNDMKAVLQLTQRPRLKDFLYFPFIKSQFNGQEFPIEHESLHNFCLKEKSINHIIYHLTKK
jgi:FKBP-type peptidyl-prolyl cis-trans isomerase (trigger factor)